MGRGVGKGVGEIIINYIRYGATPRMAGKVMRSYHMYGSVYYSVWQVLILGGAAGEGGGGGRLVGRRGKGVCVVVMVAGNGGR